MITYINIKPMKIFKAAALIVLLTLSSSLMAQVSLQINFGTQPQWGPQGYTEVRYYYLPAVEAYYDIQSSMFIYYDHGHWIHRNYLPGRYRNYDLYNGYKIVLTDYRGDSPYTHFKDHRSHYNRSYRGAPQRTIGEHPGKQNPGNQNHRQKHNRHPQRGGKHKN
jgi:hypothetical protein